MGAQTRLPTLLTWEDIDAAAVGLPPDQRELLREIVTARKAPVERASIAGGGWYLTDVTVTGHIGIGGTPVSLRMLPTNGIVFVSARNGVGKTSVADAIRHVFSGGQTRSYELAQDNIHCADTSITATITNGTRTIQLLCRGDRVVRWRDQDGVEGDVPAEWIAAFERYRPVLLHPEISPVIDNPGELHAFLKGSLELTALEELLREVDQIRKEGNAAVREIKSLYDQAVTSVSEVPDQVLLAELEDVGPTPPTEAAGPLRATITDLPASAPDQVELAETWEVDESVAAEAAEAIIRLQAARAGVVQGASSVQDALEHLLGEEGEYVADLRDQDVCPVCRTQGASWVATAAGQATRLRDLLAGVSAAEAALDQKLSRLRECLPWRLAGSTRQVLSELSHPEASNRIALWDDLVAKNSELSVDTATSAGIETVVADSKALALWYCDARAEIVSHRDDAVARRAIARQHTLSWLDAVEAARVTLGRSTIADRLSKKVTVWIKRTRDDIFEPIGKQVIEMFSSLTCDSDVEMIEITLGGGARQAQRVRIGLLAQGTPLPDQMDKPAAVLSTGQRNALSLATYLPRATQSGSPFRVLVLDDPVHAFDDWRVRYLAGRLAALANQYQIILFTHDDRLWREVRALGVHPTHFRLDRPPGNRSEVRATEITRPSKKMLDDAEVALQQEDKEAVGTPRAQMALTLTLCRQAVDTEVATQLDIVGRRLDMTDDQIQADLGTAYTTREQLNLLNRYATSAGLGAVDYSSFSTLISELNAGAHGRAPEEATLAKCREQVRDARLLADEIHAVTG